MRPSRNAFLGYTYQQCITFLLLVKMDVERQIDKLEIKDVCIKQIPERNCYICT